MRVISSFKYRNNALLDLCFRDVASDIKKKFLMESSGGYLPPKWSVHILICLDKVTIYKVSSLIHVENLESWTWLEDWILT